GGPARALLPVYLERDHAWAPPAIAALAAGRLLAAALSAPLGGALADTAGPRRTLRLGLASLPLAALAFLTPATPVLTLLILAAALPGARPRLARPPVRQLAVLRFLSTCFWGTATLLWPLLIARLSGDPATAALFGTASLALAAVAQLGAGRLIDAIGPWAPA